MKVLLDESFPRRFKRSVAGHECLTVPEVGLAGKKNGELLSLAESVGFDIFVTLDKGIEYEQNLGGRTIAVVILRAKSNRLADLLPYAQACREVIATIKRGEIVRIG